VIHFHPRKAEAFAADEARAHWHDGALWFVRVKRDRGAATVPEWEQLRAAAVRMVGSESPRGVPSFSWKSSPISSFLRWMAGMTMWEGASPASWTMRSPRSVSTTSIPRDSR
jgi:hypothetical protein